MIPAALRPTRRTAVLAVAVVATLVLSIVFDRTAFATFVFPALWIALGEPGRCAARPEST